MTNLPSLFSLLIRGERRPAPPPVVYECWCCRCMTFTWWRRQGRQGAYWLYACGRKCGAERWESADGENYV